ncbi:integral membrane family protein [Salix suchowensis]|nr:integral membrane family protein [Salix suchowensis]
MVTSGQKMAPAAEVAVQLPEYKLAVESISGTMSGPLVGGSGGGATAAMRPFGRKAEVMHVLLWLICIITSVAALSFMVTAQQSSSISIYGFTLPAQSKWSFSHSFHFEFSAGAAASGVTNLNRTGIHHTAFFCDHVAVSIFFTFTSCFLLAASALFRKSGALLVQVLKILASTHTRLMLCLPGQAHVRLLYMKIISIWLYIMSFHLCF